MGVVTPATESCNPKVTAGRGNRPFRSASLDGVSRGETPQRIRDDLLVSAYLGARFRRQYKPGEISWEDVAKTANTNKQNVIKLAGGETLGIGLLFHLANTLFEGSVDSMVRQARMWWDGLGRDEREHLFAWAVGRSQKNPIKGAESPKVSESSVPPPSETGKLPARRAR